MESVFIPTAAAVSAPARLQETYRFLCLRVSDLKKKDFVLICVSNSEDSTDHSPFDWLMLVRLDLIR